MAVYIAQFVAVNGADGRPWSGAALIPAADADDALPEALEAAYRQLPRRNFHTHSATFEPIDSNFIYTRADGRRYRIACVAVPIEADELAHDPSQDGDATV